MAEAAAAGETPLLPALPDEMVIWEILVRLLPKALLRCRAVCRAWRRATSSHDFLLVHHSHQPTLPLLYSTHGYFNEYLDIIPFDKRAGVDAADQLRSIAPLCSFNGFEINNSCDGLLVLLSVYNTNRNLYSICNPTTRQYAPLHQLEDFTILGLYRHNTTGEYRLLMYPSLYFLFDIIVAHVLTLGSDQPPRYIGCLEAKKPRNISGPVLFGAKLHWYTGQMIMVFDTIAESFRQMRSPVVSRRSYLFEMDDMIGMYSLSDKEKRVEIWVMQDYEGEVWKLKYVVELPVENIMLQLGKVDDYGWNVVATTWNGDVFVLIGLDDWLLQVDMDGQLVDNFHIEDIYPTRLRLKQSLVSHAFFPTLEGYVVNESPFISPNDKVMST